MFGSYYCLEKLDNSKTRWDLTKSCNFSSKFDRLKGPKDKDCKAYFSEKTGHIKGSDQRKPWLSMTGKGHITGVFSTSLPLLAKGSTLNYGDLEDTDLLVFVISEDLSKIEIFMAEDKNSYRPVVLKQIANGYWDSEIKEMRAKAITLTNTLL